MKPELTAIVPVERVLELAKKYPVFPCRRKDETDQEGRTLKAKSPLTRNGFKDATQDEAQIRRFWASHPDALVGVPTGSRTGLAVIDFDTSKAGAAAQDWLAENQAALVSTKVHQTGGGSGGSLIADFNSCFKVEASLTWQQAMGAGISLPSNVDLLILSALPNPLPPSAMLASANGAAAPPALRSPHAHAQDAFQRKSKNQSAV